MNYKRRYILFDLREIELRFNEVERIKKSQKLSNNCTVRISFDRKMPTFIISDGSGTIELNSKAFLELQCLTEKDFVDS